MMGTLKIFMHVLKYFRLFTTFYKYCPDINKIHKFLNFSSAKF